MHGETSFRIYLGMITNIISSLCFRRSKLLSDLKRNQISWLEWIFRVGRSIPRIPRIAISFSPMISPHSDSFVGRCKLDIIFKDFWKTLVCIKVHGDDMLSEVKWLTAPLFFLFILVYYVFRFHACHCHVLLFIRWTLWWVE